MKTMILTLLPCRIVYIVILVWILSCINCGLSSSSTTTNTNHTANNDGDEVSLDYYSLSANETIGNDNDNEQAPPICIKKSEISPNHVIPDDCQLVYAPRPGHEKQWGVFTLTSRKQGTPVTKYGDIIIQYIDPPTTTRSILRDYTWNSQVTGGQNEGNERVESIVTGLGMMAKRSCSAPNIIPFVPRIDEGGLTRFDSPGVGAITHYHNYTWWFTKDLKAGEEILFSIHDKRFSDNNEEMKTQWNSQEQTTNLNDTDDGNITERPTIEYLRNYGYCIDNIRPKKSLVKEAGRGAYATRNLDNGTIIAPVPVITIHRDELMGTDSDRNPKPQLLLNYCFGHKSIPWLLFPYSPSINLINHYNEPNVKLQWSTKTQEYLKLQQDFNVGVFNNTTLMLELVSIRDIRQGEELYLDYGRDWENSWWKHVQEIWKPIDSHYTPSYVMDDAIRLLRTEQEQKEHPYPTNVYTSCFYKYSDRTKEEQKLGHKNNKKNSSKLKSYKWQLTKGIYDLKNLRPCQVLRRSEHTKTGKSAYSVKVYNRPLLHPDEIIPEDELHIVTHIPRSAIRFSDKPYTTDQHLPNTFRHEIGLPDDLIIPEKWKESME